MNWVKARAECSLEHVFQILAEVLDSDVKEANKLGRRGVEFKINAAAERKIVVSRTRDADGVDEIVSVVVELLPGKITATRKENVKDLVKPPFLTAIPGLNRDGECLLEIGGESLRLWQASRMALEDLFFGF